LLGISINSLLKSFARNLLKKNNLGCVTNVEIEKKFNLQLAK